MSTVELLGSLLSVAAIALAAFALGRPLLRGLGLTVDDTLSAVVWSVALGMVAGGMLLTGLGLLGLLERTTITIGTLAAALWALSSLRTWYQARHDRAWSAPKPIDSKALQPAEQAPAVWLARGIFVLAAVAALASLLSAAAPPTAGDALCYHLELPKRFLAAHALVYLPDSDNSTFPLLAEMWYLWALALEGPVAAQLVHWGVGILLALGTVLLAAPIVGRGWGAVAGAVVLLVPGINNQMTAPLNDLACAALCTMALGAWWRGAVDDLGPRWLLLGGVFFGAALATKYVALLFVAAVGVVWLWYACRQPERRRAWLAGAASAAVVAVSIAGVWYLRAAWYRGNPVYPFFSELLGATGPSTLRDSKMPMGPNPLTLLTAPWQLTMYPERFGGRGHQLGALFLVCLPGLLVARRLRSLAVILGVASLYAILCLMLRQNVRFLFPLVPLLSVPLVWVWSEWERMPRWPRRTAVAITVLLLVASSAIPVMRCRRHLAVALGWQSRNSYLTQSEPTYSVASWANQLLGPEAHILSQEHRAFYFDARVTRENIYRRRTGYDRQIDKPHQLSRRLRQAGFTHLLLAESSGSTTVRYDATLSRLAEASLACGQADAPYCLLEHEFEDSDGAVRRYRLFKLR